MEMYSRSCPNCSGNPVNIFAQISEADNPKKCKTCNGEGKLYYVDGSLVSKEIFREINIFVMSEKDNSISSNEKICYRCGIGLDPDFEDAYDGCCSECYDSGT
ncbi:MAG: hypothetical protein CVV49_05355 [Spirochaetae bacterium HGW-Spirochaetae-5]|nr:MAG: hypothetical protein CVV49_05355 [Spirochaetae bacterium HGW-Spirochaetae-5]